MADPVSVSLLESICGPGGVAPAGRLWYDGPHPALAALPAGEEQTAAVLRMAADRNFAVVPRGGGTKDRLGAPLRRADLVLGTAHLNRVTEYEPADLTVTVEAGVRVCDLQALLAANGQRLAIDAPVGATVGGVVASAASGPLRYAFGGPRELVLGMRVALTSGEVIACGARVVKNVAGYDLNKLFTGSMGTLGVITQVTFKVVPKPPIMRVLSFAAPLSDGLAVMESELEPESLDWFSESSHLVVGLAGEAETVAYHERRLGELLGEPVDGAEQVLPPARTVLRAGLPPTALQPFLDAAARFFPGALVHASLAGIARVAVTDPSVLDLSDRICCLDETASKLGGHLVVEDAPVTVKQAVQVWGAPGPALALMRGLKQRFDPASILNPGRFVGGL